jgi:hypothetical protein
VMFPSYGARSSWGLQSASYAGQIAQGTRFEDVLQVMATLPWVFPHSTWIDGADNGPVGPGSPNGNAAAWRYLLGAAQSIYAAAGTQLHISGENTASGITAVELEAIFQTKALANGYNGFYCFNWNSTLLNHAPMQLTYMSEIATVLG